jgi:hypothetical protein
MSLEFLWYIPNQVDPGHRGDDAIAATSRTGQLQTMTARRLSGFWPGMVLGRELRKALRRFTKAAHFACGRTWSGSARDGKRLDTSRSMT